jgi:hypothetical protein
MFQRTAAFVCAFCLACIFAVDAHAGDIASAWSAPPTVSVIKIDKTFRDGSVTLSGTLYMPVTDHKVSAIIAFQAASTSTRDLPLFRHLKQMLPSLGVAVLIFDRRGSGKSGGTPADGNYEALADDGIAALHMLAHDSHIDARKIGFWGLSQGGWISLLAASRCSQAAFAISISAPMVTPDVQMVFAVQNILRIDGYPQGDIDLATHAREAVDKFERGQLDRATAQKRLDAVISKPWFPFIYMDKTFHDPAQSGWAKEERQDPLKWLAKDKLPTLILYGAKDPWVPVKTSVARIEARAAQLPNISLRVLADADHDMMLSATPMEQVDPQNLTAQAPEDPEYFAVLAAWLTAHGIAQAPR